MEALLDSCADHALAERARTGLHPHWTLNIVAANGRYLVAVGWSSSLVVREEGVSLDETAHRALVGFREFASNVEALEKTLAIRRGGAAANVGQVGR